MGRHHRSRGSESPSAPPLGPGFTTSPLLIIPARLPDDRQMADAPRIPRRHDVASDLAGRSAPPSLTRRPHRDHAAPCWLCGNDSRSEKCQQSLLRIEDDTAPIRCRSACCWHPPDLSDGSDPVAFVLQILSVHGCLSLELAQLEPAGQSSRRGGGLSSCTSQSLIYSPASRYRDWRRGPVANKCHHRNDLEHNSSEQFHQIWREKAIRACHSARL